MESRVRVLFLIGALFAMSGCAATKNLFGIGHEEAAPSSAEEPGQVIEPEVERRKIKEPAIDREDFEVGGFVGMMSIEDFGTNFVYGARLAYHVTEGFFIEGTLGTTKAGLTSFEELSGGARLIDDRKYTYYNLNVGYNVLPGEVFIGKGHAYNTALYVIAVDLGAGYRFLLTDSVALHADFRDHLFDIDLLGDNKTVHNFEAHLGVTVFF